MTNIGSFGSKQQTADLLEFDYFGETIRANNNLGELDYVEFLASAGAVGVEDLASLGLVKGFAELCIDPEDFTRFWALARKNRQRVEDVFKVLEAIVEATVDRPTSLPSDSAGGPTSTATKSAADDSARALSQLAGRPDLQLFVTKVAEAV